MLTPFNSHGDLSSVLKIYIHTPAPAYLSGSDRDGVTCGRRVIEPRSAGRRAAPKNQHCLNCCDTTIDFRVGSFATGSSQQ